MLGRVRSWVEHFCPGSRVPRRGRILLPMSRIAGLSGRSGEFVYESNISAPRSSKIPAGMWARLSGFVSIFLTHLFHKEESLGNAMASLTGLSRGAR
jgi:hypothetical protein